MDTDFTDQLKTLKSHTQTAEEFLFRLRKCHRLKSVQRLKHPCSLVKQEQASRGRVYENDVLGIGLFQSRD
jgi:hypothetical protein